MNAHRIALEDWALPKWREHLDSLFFADPFKEVIDYLHLPAPRKDCCELFFRRLENTKSRVGCAIDDLNVLHIVMMTSVAYVRNRSFADMPRLVEK